MHYDLLELCEFPFTTNLTLLYRGTRDGFSAKSFHEKCDSNMGTLTIIKSDHGNIFGGFTTNSWTSEKALWLKDPAAFIFSLINKEKNTFKALVKNDSFATLSSTIWGPEFGSQPQDIRIDFDTHNNDSWSSSFFGNSYEHPDYKSGTKRAKVILAGTERFRILELEVFAKID